MKQSSTIRFLVQLVVVVAVSCAGSLMLMGQDAPTAKEKRQVRALASTIDKAGRLFKSKKYQSSGDRIQRAQLQLFELAAAADPELMKLIEPEYERLSKAHAKIKEQNIELPVLPPLPAPISNDGPQISFKDQVAPILVSRCGRCHVNQSRGQFSAATYRALMDSLHVSPGKSDTSMIVEMIADGAMPPNGQVPGEELDTLKRWIRQGAKFDGDDPSENLGTMVGDANAGGQRPRPMQVVKPKGTETVSFGRDVAPILIESCSGCHLNTQRIRGNLNMNNFARMLRGGDSGNLFSPGASEQSLIVKRLKGIDSTVMPPRNKLNDGKIALIEKWIAEGGSYDGTNPQLDIKVVASTAAANAQTHAELSIARKQLAENNWKLIMSNDQPDLLDDDEFRVVGSNLSNRLEETVNIANELRQQVVDTLRSDPERPFVKGKATIYLFEKRYDFNELGLMLAGRELPKNQTGRWDYTTVDAYAAVILNRGKSPEELRPALAQQLAALHIAALAPDIPRWFADGVGYATAARMLRKNDNVKRWKSVAADIYSQMPDPFAFTSGKLNESESGLAGYVFVQEMAKGGRLNSLLQSLQAGTTFADAFESVMNLPPEDFFKTGRDNRGRRR